MMNFGDEKLPPEFWDFVIPEPNSGCWIWLGSTRGAGYSQFTSPEDGIQRTAHSFVFRVFNDGIPMPIGLEIDHTCKMSLCVNPAHLQAVTHAVNMLRSRRTHCKKGHPLSGSNLYVWLDPSTGYQRRYCIACREARRA